MWIFFRIKQIFFKYFKMLLHVNTSFVISANQINYMLIIDDNTSKDFFLKNDF